jgi:hypothetical protein
VLSKDATESLLIEVLLSLEIQKDEDIAFGFVEAGVVDFWLRQMPQQG